MTAPLFASQSLDPAVVEAAREELRRQLPELRSLPGCPIGSDEDILAMSVPPFYTACPNPFIRDLLQESAPEGYESRTYVDPGPFVADVSAGKRHPLYQAHSYWTKVPHEAIARFILHYTKPGDVVLDGFAGTGMVGVAAQVCAHPDATLRLAVEAEQGDVEWGARRVALQDLSVAASVVSAGLNLPIDGDRFEQESGRLLEQFARDLGWMYETQTDDGRSLSVDYIVWSDVMTCTCGLPLVYFDLAFDEERQKFEDDFVCPSCGVETNKAALGRRYTDAWDPLLGRTVRVVERQPVRVYFQESGQERWKPCTESDLSVLRAVEALIRDVEVPTSRIPYMHLTHERNDLTSSGITHFHHLWPSRALVALSWFWRAVALQEDPLLRTALSFWIEQAFWGMSRMVVFSRQVYSMVNQYRKGYYHVPAVSGEVSVAYYLGRRRESYVRALRAKTASSIVIQSVASTEKLLMSDESADYVFVDPPFGENIYYADLDYLTDTWYHVCTNREAEATVDRSRREPRRLADYSLRMERCFSELFRVLKPGRWMTVEFSNSSNEVWQAIQEALSSAGFVVADTRVFDKQQGSYRQVTAKNVVKRDLIISAYKPSAVVEERFALVAGSVEGAWEFVREHLSHLPVTEGSRGEARVVRERMADRLYDRMVAYHVHRGVTVPLTAGEFYAGLEQRFPVRDDMYFLSEQVEAYERHRMTVKELVQAELFITNEQSAVQWLRQLLKRKPRTYAEIHPLFMTESQAGVPDWEVLPELRDLLEGSFLQDGQGRWYVPDPKKAEDLERLRTRGLLREFQAYVEGRGRLERFRSEAVRAGFKDAWGRREFATIVTVGKRLPEDAFVEDEALLYYYDNARRLTDKA